MQRRAQQIDFVAYGRRQVAGRTMQRHAGTQCALAVVEQAVDQAAQLHAPVEDAFGLACVRRAAGAVQQEFRRAHYRSERTPQIVAQCTEEDVAPRLHRARELHQRLGHGLVDGLVEADHVVDGGGQQGFIGRPPPQHRGAQSAVLGDHLVDAEPIVRTAASVAGRGGFGTGRRRRPPLRLGVLLLRTLFRPQVGHDLAQDQRNVVAQPLVVQLRTFRGLRDGELDGIVEDLLRVSLYEIGKSHEHSVGFLVRCGLTVVYVIPLSWCGVAVVRGQSAMLRGSRGSSMWTGSSGG